MDLNERDSTTETITQKGSSDEKQNEDTAVISTSIKEPTRQINNVEKKEPSTHTIKSDSQRIQYSSNILFSNNLKTVISTSNINSNEKTPYSIYINIDSMIQSFILGLNQKMYIIGANDFIFEITTIENEIDILNEKSENTYNSSIIDLGECNNLLKQKYFQNNKNVSLIILKFENTINYSSEKNIKFEIYEPFNKTKLDLSICQNKSIDIYIPTQLNDKTQKLIEKLEKLGYDIFNINSPFYTDFCAKYTTEDGTDMILADRKKYIYEAIMNEINCQENCEFSSYDTQKRYLECSCKIEEKIDTIDYEKFNSKKIYQSFYDVLKYSNYKVIYCYKLVFNKDNFNYNKGCWIIFILFILYLTQLVIYLFKKTSPLKLNIARYHFRQNIKEKNIENIHNKK